MTLDTKKNRLIVPPIVYSRGFNVSEDAHVIRHAQMHAQEVVNQVMAHKASFGEIKSAIKDALSHYIYRRTERSPMIVPIIMSSSEK